jgi:hypothetical protein
MSRLKFPTRKKSERPRSGSKKVSRVARAAKELRRGPTVDHQAGRMAENRRAILARAAVDDGDKQSPADVLLDIPTVKVDEISLEVDELHAQVALEAGVANLIKLVVGADVTIGRVQLTIKGVEAQALLKVRLQHVQEILGRALQTIDKNPELLISLLRPVGEAAQDAVGPGGALEEAVSERGTLSKAADGLGGAAQKALGPGGAVASTAQQVGGAVGNALGPNPAAAPLLGSAAEVTRGATRLAGLENETDGLVGQIVEGRVVAPVRGAGSGRAAAPRKKGGKRRPPNGRR